MMLASLVLATLLADSSAASPDADLQADEPPSASPQPPESLPPSAPPPSVASPASPPPSASLPPSAPPPSAPTAPSESPPSAPTPPSSDRVGQRFSTRLAGGASYGRLGDIPAHGGDAVVALGGMGTNFGWSIEGSLFAGRTQNGLAMLRSSLGPNLDVRFWRLGFGAGFAFSRTSIQRTTNGATILIGAASGVLRVTFDVVTFDPHHALFLGLRTSYGAGGDIAHTSVGLLLGYRFRS
jgi:hypothetical protein